MQYFARPRFHEAITAKAFIYTRQTLLRSAAERPTGRNETGACLFGAGESEIREGFLGRRPGDAASCSKRESGTSGVAPFRIARARFYECRI